MKNKAKLKNRQTRTTTNNDLQNATQKTKCEDSKWATCTPSVVNGRRTHDTMVVRKRTYNDQQKTAL
jgi:hypothetical protein